MTVKVRTFTGPDAGQWDQFVRNHEKGTFFHLTGWKFLIEKSFGHKSHYLIAETDDRRIAGVFPVFSINSLLFGKSVVSIPFSVYGGVLAETEDAFSALYDSAVEFTKTQNAQYLEMRNEDAVSGDLPSKDLYYVFKREIEADDEKNMAAIPRKARRMIRVAIKNGLQARFGRHELVDSFYTLLAVNFHRLGTPVFSKRYIRNILDQYPDDCSILIISKDGVDLSGVLSFFYKDQVIPYYSGSIPESNKTAGNDFLYWALMSRAAEKGYRFFDFGRSKKDTGPYHFKRHWGFEPKPLEYQYFLNTLDELPNISPSNPKYQKRIEMWRRLPLWLTTLVGPHIVKNIP